MIQDLRTTSWLHAVDESVKGHTKGTFFSIAISRNAASFSGSNGKKMVPKDIWEHVRQ